MAAGTQTPKVTNSREKRTHNVKHKTYTGKTRLKTSQQLREKIIIKC